MHAAAAHGERRRNVSRYWPADCRLHFRRRAKGPRASPRRLLFSTGGDLSAHFLSALGTESVRLLDEAEPGVPFGMHQRGRF